MMFFWRALVLGSILLSVAACGDDDDTASTSTTTSSTTSQGGTPLTVEELLEMQPDGPVTVRGGLIDEGAGFLLCDALAESLPPQCGGRWVVVVNAEGIGATLTTEGVVTWSDQPVEITGSLEQGRLVPADSAGEAEPTAEDVAIVDAFVSFASAGDAADPATLPLGEDGLALGLASELLVTRSAGELADPSGWEVDHETFRARVGPFSARELLAEARPTVVLVGPHDHCAAPPVAVPDSVRDLRHLSVSPTDATSCLEWFTVDLFVDADGTVQAVTLDLWEP